MSVPSLAELRLAIGRKGYPLRQDELAREVKVKQGYVSQFESGKRMPSIYLQHRLAEVCGLTLEQVRASVAETVRRYKQNEKQIPQP